MKGLKVKIMTVVLIVMITALAMPITTFAENSESENLQIVKTAEGYIIYVKGLLNTKFYYAIGENDEDLDYTIARTDDKENKIASVSEEADGKNLYIRTTSEDGTEKVTSTKLNLTEAFDEEKMQEVEKTTERIKTTPLPEEEMNVRKEVVDGKERTITTDGLKIEGEGTYYYTTIKLPATDSRYDELMTLAKILNNESYNKLDRYTMIEAEKNFYDLYTELKAEQKWNKVEDKKILQPEESKTGDEYVVFIKEVDSEGKEVVDAKFMIAKRVEDEGVATTSEVKEVKRTSKLPITGDSIVLFVILAVIVLALILIFVRMKKLQNKEAKH